MFLLLKAAFTSTYFSRVVFHSSLILYEFLRPFYRKYSETPFSWTALETVWSSDLDANRMFSQQICEPETVRRRGEQHRGKRNIIKQRKAERQTHTQNSREGHEWPRSHSVWRQTLASQHGLLREGCAPVRSRKFRIRGFVQGYSKARITCHCTKSHASRQ